MTLQLSPQLEQHLQRIADGWSRTPDEVAAEAIEQYLDHIDVLTAEAREAEESAERDGWVPHEEVFARLNERLRKSA